MVSWVMVLLAMPALAWALFLSLVFGFGDAGPIYAVILAGIPFVIVNVKDAAWKKGERFGAACVFEGAERFPHHPVTAPPVSTGAGGRIGKPSLLDGLPA